MDKVIVKNEAVYCPHCKEYLFEEEFMWDFEDYKFCPYCGQSITTKEKEEMIPMGDVLDEMVGLPKGTDWGFATEEEFKRLTDYNFSISSPEHSFTDEELAEHDAIIVQRFAEWYAEMRNISWGCREDTIKRWIEDFNDWRKENG